MNKQISYDLGVSEKSVKVHRAAESLADLVQLAERAGIGPQIMEYWPVLYRIEKYFLLTLSHRIDNYLCVIKLNKGG